MGNFNRGNRRGDGRDFGRRGFGSRGSDRPLHQATCSRCGNECEVPFRPTGVRPVFCSKCFEENWGSDSRRSGGRDFGRGGSNAGQYQDQFETLNSKLDKILKMLTPAVSIEDPMPKKQADTTEKKEAAAKKTTSTKER